MCYSAKKERSFPICFCAANCDVSLPDRLSAKCLSYLELVTFLGLISVFTQKQKDTQECCF